MSLSTLNPNIQYTGNGSTTSFDFDHKYYNDSDIVVVLTDAAGADTVQTITTHYTLTGKADDAHDQTTGTVEMITAPAGGGTPELLTIYRKPALTQLLTLLTTGGWYSVPVEQQLDLLVMIAQDFQLQLDRTAKYAYTNLSTPSSLELLELAAGAGLISGLPGLTTLADADLFRVGDTSDSGTEKKLTALNLLTYIQTNSPAKVSIEAIASTVDVTVLDGHAYIMIPPAMNGWSLSYANAGVITAGTTNPTTIDIYNVTQAVDMLSTAISIASAATVGTAGTVKTNGDEIVSTNDILRVDGTTVSATPPKGLVVPLQFIP
jgi:hypothetical protein